MIYVLVISFFPQREVYGIVLRDTGDRKLESQIKWYSNNEGQVIDKFRSLSMINEDFTFKY